MTGFNRRENFLRKGFSFRQSTAIHILYQRRMIFGKTSADILVRSAFESKERFIFLASRCEQVCPRSDQAFITST